MTTPIAAMVAYHHQSRHYPGTVIHIHGQGRTVSGTLRGYDQNQPPGQQQAITDAARFRIASLTKGMVSMVALMLIDQGKLRLDMPAAEVLPELADMRLIGGQGPASAPTVAHLLSHTAGFGSLGETNDPQAREHNAQVALDGQLPVMSREQFLNALSQRVLSAEPGTQFQYGFSTDVVGQIIERVTGQSLFGAMQAHLFAPLDMTRTTFHVPPDEHVQMPRAFSEDQAWHRFVGVFDAADEQVAEMGIDAHELRGPLQSAGGGLVAPIDDVCAYAQMIADGGKTSKGQRLISQSLFDQAMSNHLGPTVSGPYNFTGGGFGFGLAGAIRNDWAPAAYPSKVGEFCWSGITGHTLFVAPGKGWYAVMLSSNTASRVIVRFEFRRAAEPA